MTVIKPDLAYIAEPLRPLAVPIASLLPDPANARKHGPKNLDAIAGSLAVYGQQKPLVVRQETMTVVAGNGTLEAARTLGWTHLAANVVSMDAATAAGFAVSDNRSAELAEWDKAALDAQLRSLATGNDERLDAMLADLAEDQGLYLGNGDGSNGQAEDPGPQIDRAAELQARWRTERGQLWEVPSKSVPGKSHRLLCGDSTQAEDVGRVMGGEKAGLMNTDPPYGVAYDHEIANDVKRDMNKDDKQYRRFEEIKGDDLSGEKLQAFLEACIRVAVPNLYDNTAFYLWHPMLTQGTFFAAAAAAAADILIHRQIIWVKPHFIIGRGDYHWQHELCFYGWRRGHRPSFYGERNQSTTWRLNEGGGAIRKEQNHPTQKPVELFVRPMNNHLKIGEIAYEPFAGSGSQYVAAEQTGRLCYGVEIDPRYVAVALERLAGLGLSPQLA